jgi:hypothetical protein
VGQLDQHAGRPGRAGVRADAAARGAGAVPVRRTLLRPRQAAARPQRPLHLAGHLEQVTRPTGTASGGKGRGVHQSLDLVGGADRNSLSQTPGS